MNGHVQVHRFTSTAADERLRLRAISVADDSRNEFTKDQSELVTSTLSAHTMRPAVTSSTTSFIRFHLFVSSFSFSFAKCTNWIKHTKISMTSLHKAHSVLTAHSLTHCQCKKGEFFIGYFAFQIFTCLIGSTKRVAHRILHTQSFAVQLLDDDNSYWVRLFFLSFQCNRVSLSFSTNEFKRLKLPFEFENWRKKSVRSKMRRLAKWKWARNVTFCIRNFAAQNIWFYVRKPNRLCGRATETEPRCRLNAVEIFLNISHSLPLVTCVGIAERQNCLSTYLNVANGADSIFVQFILSWPFFSFSSIPHSFSFSIYCSRCCCCFKIDFSILFPCLIVIHSFIHSFREAHRIQTHTARSQKKKHFLNKLLFHQNARTRRDTKSPLPQQNPNHRCIVYVLPFIGPATFAVPRRWRSIDLPIAFTYNIAPLLSSCVGQKLMNLQLSWASFSRSHNHDGHSKCYALFIYFKSILDLFELYLRKALQIESRMLKSEQCQ